MDRYDIIVVGYGPTGMVLAAMLGRLGHRVAVIERHRDLYNLPRAATFDDETMRAFQKLGCAEEVAEGTKVQATYQWCNADGELLIEHVFEEYGRSGWPEWYMIYQPHLDSVLDRVCRGLATVDVLQGWTAESIEQDEDGVVVSAASPEGGVRSFVGVFVVGCDGGNSAVRRILDIGRDDYGFEEPWLVCDFKLRRPIDLHPARQMCDPAQPTAIVQLGPEHRRFSFMLNEDETVEQAIQPESVWRRVSRWVTEDDVEMIRVAYYTFRSLIATRWRSGGVFLAGDAAHEMPPFLGQGMCSGIRDAHNLAWKLDLVLTGRATDALLDTYQAEREPHVRAITEKAIELGRIQTLRDPEAARARDDQWRALRAAQTTPERLRFPGLRAGVLAAGGVPAVAGGLFPQGRVRVDEVEGLFDDLVGDGFTLIARGPIVTGLTDELASWQRAGGMVATLGPTTDALPGVAFEDVDGRYDAWLSEHGCEAVVVRPDWYVFGAAADAAELGVLLKELAGRFGWSADGTQISPPASAM